MQLQPTCARCARLQAEGKQLVLPAASGLPLPRVVVGEAVVHALVAAMQLLWQADFSLMARAVDSGVLQLLIERFPGTLSQGYISQVLPVLHMTCTAFVYVPCPTGFLDGTCFKPRAGCLDMIAPLTCQLQGPAPACDHLSQSTAGMDDAARCQS